MPAILMDRGCIIEYNDNDQVVYSKDMKSGFEVWKEYDENNRLSRTKDSLGFESWYKYDINENLVNVVSLMHDKILKETTYEYDEKGNLIHLKDTNGFEAWYEYNKDGKEIRYINSNGYEERN